MNHSYSVDETGQGLRLDVFLANAVAEVPSRTFIRKLIDNGQVKVNGALPFKVNYKVMLGDKIEVDLDPAQLLPKELVAEHMELDVLYEDADLIVINKPVGLTVHPAVGNFSGTLANALMGRFKDLSDLNGPVRPGIVHRLDRDTSGLIIVAKTNVAHARLGRQFEKHTVRKTYVARAQGKVQFDEGMIDVPLKQHVKYHDQRQVAKEGDKGKEAVTRYKVIHRFTSSTLVMLFPRTGRTHQLRVHMKHLGHPILGDDKYGRKGSFSRLALHAKAIAFSHPITKQYIEFSCPLPKEFLREDAATQTA